MSGYLCARRYLLQIPQVNEISWFNSINFARTDIWPVSTSNTQLTNHIPSHFFCFFFSFYQHRGIYVRYHSPYDLSTGHYVICGIGSAEGAITSYNAIKCLSTVAVA